MDELDEFALTLTGDGISIEKTIDKRLAAAIMALILGDEGRETAASVTVKPVNPPANTPSNIREFLSQSDVEINSKRITAIGHFICEYQGKESFNKEDIKDGFRSAREVFPKNFSRDFNNAIDANYIHPAAKNGEYYVTVSGVKAIESKFDRND